MLASLNRSFSKIPLLIGGSHTQNSRCFPFTNPLETFGNILANLSQHYTDYQYYTKQKIVQAWNRPVVRSTTWGFSHCPSKLNRQRQSPRRYELCTNPLETYINNGFAPNKGAKLAYKVSRESDKITPGASTVAKFEIRYWNFARISDCLKHSVE